MGSSRYGKALFCDSRATTKMRFRCACKPLRRDPEYVLAYWMLGLAHEAAGYLELASAEFETAEVLSGGSPRMLSALAYNRAIQGDDQSAKELLETAYHFRRDLR
jgi:Flp pilus assembly protein TadD